MRFKFPQFFVVLLMICALTLGGCASNTTSSSASPTATATSDTTTSAKTVSETISESVPGIKGLPRLEGKATVVMTVKRGEVVNPTEIEIEIDGTNAPITGGNFVDLVQKGVYDGLVFHRVVREPQPFVVQGGDPQGKDPKFPESRLGTSGYIDPQTGNERRIPLEIKPKGAKDPIYSKTITEKPVLQHKQGAIAMARSQSPDSASSQFYFALADLSFLDGNYAVFGNVTKGFEVVNKIQQGDRIESAKVTTGAENLKIPQ
ncbi:peptidylprolyl isomerase [Aphanizomenon sp. PH219]|uniref:Peptidyl-prolyl cis-trans isomerase n=1 Tax=Dolichospermum heterosporum TAC447 TaxID=747523 RepID=A0ABY5M819_9CYAN|nr:MULTISPECIES: peptidylprolyl isomerase [Aphanizomenonaceae]MDK2409540.1 peptidylprolyl isomerase [Aphanizomenon sp. 202]MDK2458271.1 peptidylprolyl isomerase [Aphanizomenon sp. PH219]UUO18014.1 peptidylprolyl isomerase [Dolichospermum heterosporum TAC447]